MDGPPTVGVLEQGDPFGQPAHLVEHLGEQYLDLGAPGLGPEQFVHRPPFAVVGVDEALLGRAEPGEFRAVPEQPVALLGQLADPVLQRGQHEQQDRDDLLGFVQGQLEFVALPPGLAELAVEGLQIAVLLLHAPAGKAAAGQGTAGAGAWWGRVAGGPQEVEGPAEVARVAGGGRHQGADELFGGHAAGEVLAHGAGCPADGPRDVRHRPPGGHHQVPEEVGEFLRLRALRPDRAERAPAPVRLCHSSPPDPPDRCCSALSPNNSRMFGRSSGVSR